MKTSSITRVAVVALAATVAGAVLPAFAQEAPTIPQQYLDKGVIAGMFCGTGVISYCDPNSTEGKGILAEINQAWAKEAGLDIRIEGQTWEALMPSAVSGRTDMVAGIGDIESRRAQFSFVDVFYGFYGLVVPAGNPAKIATWTDLCGKTLAQTPASGEEQTVNARSTEYCVSKGLEPIKLEILGEQAATFVALQSGRVNATLTDMFGAAKLVGDNPTIYAEAFRERGSSIWGIAVPVDDPELLEVVKYGVAKGFKSGSIKAVLDKYGVGQIMVEKLMVNSAAVE